MRLKSAISAGKSGEERDKPLKIASCKLFSGLFSYNGDLPLIAATFLLDTFLWMGKEKYRNDDNPESGGKK